MKLAAALALLALAAPMALAQVPQPSLSVTLDASSASLGLSNSTTILATVAYADTAPAVPGAGSTDAAIDVTVSAPEGWTASVEPAALSLSPGQSADVTVTLTAPATASAAAGEAIVSATSSSAGGRAATASAPIALTLVLPPPPPVPWYQTPAGMAGIGAAILLALGAAFATWRSRQKRLAAEREAAERAAYLARETGITIAVGGGPTQYGHRREIMYRVRVTNTSERPRVALVEVASATDGWRAALQVARLPLSPGETQPVTLVVTPDAVITPGDRASVVVRAKPEEAREKDERVTIDVVAPKHGVPTDPNYRIVTVHREGAGTPGLKP